MSFWIPSWLISNSHWRFSDVGPCLSNQIIISKKKKKKMFSRIFLDIWLPVNFLFTLKASSLPDMESIYFTTKSYFTSICFLRVQMNSLFYMSVKKSGSYITIPVFDVSWVVNFLKQVSMRFGILKHFLRKAFSVKNLNYHSKFQLNFCFFNCPSPHSAGQYRL